jgi:hypothetical protein
MELAFGNSCYIRDKQTEIETPAPVGSRISTNVRSELYLSTVVTTDSVEIGVAVGDTVTISVSTSSL